MMSFSRIFDLLAVQDDNATAAIIAEALNSDQRIRQHMGLDTAHDAASLHRVARLLAAHNVPTMATREIQDETSAGEP